MKISVLSSLAAAGIMALVAGGVPASAAPTSPAGITGANELVSEVQTRRRTYRRRAARARQPVMRPSRDGNVEKPSRLENVNAPAAQRGSGTQSGGPANERIRR